MDIESMVTGKTRVIGIIGNPIEHSISPQLHNTLSRQLGLNIIYVPFKVEGSDLGCAVKGLKCLNVLGFNVTIPYKESIISYLDEITEEAELMGSVNTVKNIEGKLFGFNTDARGFVQSFTKEAKATFKDKTVAIIGAGGTARALAVKIALEESRKIYIINRTLQKAEEIASRINDKIGNVALAVNLDSKESTLALSEADILVNTTPLGMYPDTERTPLNKDFRFSKNQIVFDVIYNPRKTLFLARAEECGCTIVNGFGMLISQGIQAYEIWTDTKIPSTLSEQVQDLLLKYI
ncbi:MAG TPA: shikimate dehydrogenase [Clostridiaceae bacterium]|nr:shikimate dehydrogenase [Clostridiaceae bacterium]